MRRKLQGSLSGLLSLTVVFTLLPFTSFSTRANAQSLNLNQTVQNTSQLLSVSGDLLELVLHPTNGTKVKVTRLAHGVPVGGDLDYLDEGTLAAAIRQRTPF